MLAALLLTPCAIIGDAIIGDPRLPLHPIRLIAIWLRVWEAAFFKLCWNDRWAGMLHWLLVVGGSYGAWSLISQLAHQRQAWIGFTFDLVCAIFLLCSRSLIGHARAVWKGLDHLETAQIQVGLMVGRDTDRMDQGAVVRACIESLSENLVDGVLTPLIAFAIFGLPGLVIVKAISTLDSMVGYRNERYRHFGWAAAKADDLIHYLPARLSPLLIALAARCSGERPKAAFASAVLWHDLLPSPNSGWSEAAFAGALRVRLLGPIHRDGELVDDRWLGDPGWPQDLGQEHLQRAIRLAIWCILIASSCCIAFASLRVLFAAAMEG